MENYKIDLFENEYKIAFPSYANLADEECTKLSEEISKRYKLPTSSLVEGIRAKQTVLDGLNAETNFSLKEFLSSLSIRPMPELYINWYRYDEIDMFNLDDLDKYFNDIWFPSSDDIDLFDKSLDWIVSVRHDGVISYVKQDK